VYEHIVLGVVLQLGSAPLMLLSRSQKKWCGSQSAQQFRA
jgi:hypothetical protein